MNQNLNNDVSADEARALHRVVRAMHDGHCPACGNIEPSEHFYFFIEGRHKCPKCRFHITFDEAAEALKLFQPYMQANLAVFEAWRKRCS